MIIKFSKTFVKQRNRAPKKIQEALNMRMELFIENYCHSKLRMHKLKGILKDYYSIDINGDWRVIFKILNKNEVVVFLMFGSHSSLYK